MSYSITHGGKGRNTRDVGLESHGAGKGDAPRNVGPAFSRNFDEIDWRRDESRPASEQRGNRKVYRYDA